MGRWLVLFATGCSADICERTAQADEDCGVPVSEADVEACQTGLAGCSSADVGKIEAWFECTEEAGALACEPSAGALEEGLACISGLEGLSDACDISRSGTFDR